MRLITVPGVFRPRSDAWLLAAALSRESSRGASVLDVFTGSGVLAVAAGRSGAARVTAVDVSRRAVACARLNGRLNGVRVRALRGDLFAPVGDERFDVIVANPPYLPSVGGASRPRGSARAWEGGADGRSLLDRLCDEAADHLLPGGVLILVQSSVSGLDPTLVRLADAGLRADVIDRRRGPLGALLSARARELEQRGILRPGVREEELLVVRAKRDGLGERAG
jgi:release factor glutamine methyltransferase